MKLTRMQLESSLRDAKLNGRQVELSGQNLTGLDLSNLDLSGASLVRANLNNANLCGTKLKAAVLAQADLSEARLVTANLFGANLYSANLEKANLMGANLEQASLVGVNGNQVDLLLSNLRYAILERADLRLAHLNGANLLGCSLIEVNMSGAFYNHLTQWPQGFDPVLAKAVFSRDIDRYLAEAYRVYSTLLWSSTLAGHGAGMPKTIRSRLTHARHIGHVEETVKMRESDWDTLRRLELRSSNGILLHRAFVRWLRVVERLADRESSADQAALESQRIEHETEMWECYLKHREIFSVPVLCSCRWGSADTDCDDVMDYQSLRSFSSKQEFVRFHEACYTKSRKTGNQFWTVAVLLVLAPVILVLIVMVVNALSLDFAP